MSGETWLAAAGITFGVCCVLAGITILIWGHSHRKRKKDQ